MTLESTVWRSIDSEQLTYLVFDHTTRRLANASNVTIENKGPYYSGEGAFYEITNDTDPQTGNTRVRVFGEFTDGWRDEFYRIEGDKPFWKTPKTKDFYRWERVAMEELPKRAIAAVDRVFERMKDKA